MMTEDLMQITLSKENYKILHQLICNQMETIFSPFDDDEDYEPTQEHLKILDEITLFSSYQITHNV